MVLPPVLSLTTGSPDVRSMVERDERSSGCLVSGVEPSSKAMEASWVFPNLLDSQLYQ